jgi:hypothetical protein
METASTTRGNKYWFFICLILLLFKGQTCLTGRKVCFAIPITIGTFRLLSTPNGYGSFHSPGKSKIMNLIDLRALSTRIELNLFPGGTGLNLGKKYLNWFFSACNIFFYPA